MVLGIGVWYLKPGQNKFKAVEFVAYNYELIY